MRHIQLNLKGDFNETTINHINKIKIKTKEKIPSLKTKLSKLHRI